MIPFYDFMALSTGCMMASMCLILLILSIIQEVHECTRRGINLEQPQQHQPEKSKINQKKQVLGINNDNIKKKQ